MNADSDGNLIEIRGLTREFGRRGGIFGPNRSMRAVNDVSMDVPRGKVTGVVGESGCGKSTLARLVLRLIDASEGTIKFDGIDLGKLPAGELRRLRQRMQMVFQDPYSAIDPCYSIRKALLEPFRVQGVALSSRQGNSEIDELIEMVGLSPRMAASSPAGRNSASGLPGRLR